MDPRQQWRLPPARSLNPLLSPYKWVTRFIRVFQICEVQKLNTA